MSHLRTSICLAALGLSLNACVVASPQDGDEGPAATSDEQLIAQQPIPYVLQYVGQYNGAPGASVSWIAMRRTGTFAAMVNGVIRTGVYYGPKAPADPLKIVFVMSGERPWTGVISGWQPYEKMTLTRTLYNGTTKTEVVTAKWWNGNETMCDETGGNWTDDDADPATGLFCVCPTGQTWIPAYGGCIR